MSKKSRTWKFRAVNAKTGTPPVVTLPEKLPREKYPDPAWIVPHPEQTCTTEKAIHALFMELEPTMSATNAVLAGK